MIAKCKECRNDRFIPQHRFVITKNSVEPIESIAVCAKCGAEHSMADMLVQYKEVK